MLPVFHLWQLILNDKRLGLLKEAAGKLTARGLRHRPVVWPLYKGVPGGCRGSGNFGPTIGSLDIRRYRAGHSPTFAQDGADG